MSKKKNYKLLDFTDIYPDKLMSRDEIVKNPGYPQGEGIYRYCCNLLGHQPKITNPFLITSSKKFDYRGWDVLRFEPDHDGYVKYNKLIDEIGKYRWNKMSVTASGCPSKKHYMNQSISFVSSDTRTDIWIAFNNGTGMHVIFGTSKGSEGYVMSGSEAYRRFCELVKKQDKYNFDDCSIDEQRGNELHDSFPKGHTYKIEMNTLLKDEELSNCYEIDINSSFPFGMREYAIKNNIPVVNTINYLYNEKKKAKGKNQNKYEEYKAIMNLACGMFWSEIIDRKHADFSAYAVQRNNDRLIALRNKLEHAGYVWVGYATDAIWYWDPKNIGEYTDEEFGVELGQLKTTHAKRLQYKSAGCYQWEDDDNVTHSVMRGRCKYDEIVSRDKWEWGTIYKVDGVFVYRFDKNTGKMIEEELE